jgi:uncharacterized protein (TIGR02145 family)
LYYHKIIVMKRNLFYLFAAFAADALMLAGCGEKDNDNGGGGGGGSDDPDDPRAGVEIKGIVWATRNVGSPGTVVSKPEDFGYYDTFDEAQTVCPDGWRTPTTDEFQSLVSAGNGWTSRNGVNGRMFGIANNQNQIFIPAAGLLGTDGQFSEVGTYGYYWSALPYSTTYGYHLYFRSGRVSPLGSSSRSYGFSVRCVAE